MSYLRTQLEDPVKCSSKRKRGKDRGKADIGMKLEKAKLLLFGS